jgi:hypothetical protein
MFESLNFNMETRDWITTAAVILGPILAVQAQKFVEAFREKRRRRLSLFTTLMSTRAERLSRNHVQALNMIDIEFYGRKVFGTRFQTRSEKAVTNAWKNYNQHLNERKAYESLDSWLKRADELFTKILYDMSQALKYDFDEVQLRRDCYRPEAHVNLENTQLAVLAGLEKVLKGEQSLPMAVTYFPSQEQVAPKEGGQRGKGGEAGPP